MTDRLYNLISTAHDEIDEARNEIDQCELAGDYETRAQCAVEGRLRLKDAKETLRLISAEAKSMDEKAALAVQWLTNLREIAPEVLLDAMPANCPGLVVLQKMIPSAC